MTAYYNENEPHAAQWLRNLIAADLIAPGEVDERDIRDVRPEDVRGYTQCHWFAGIAVWSYALRRAGWPDDRPVWTGSLPCQPFSIAGKRAGTADRRYLWPEMFRFVRECRPITVFGEQVASPDGRAWLDAVSADLEGVGYRIGSVDTCAAGFGAPQIRQRLWWVADALGERRGGWSGLAGVPAGPCEDQPAGAGGAGRLADDGGGGCDSARAGVSGEEGEARKNRHDAVGRRGAGGVGHSAVGGSGARDGQSRTSGSALVAAGRSGVSGGMARADCGNGGASVSSGDDNHGTQTGREEGDGEPAARSATSGFWADADWLMCRDWKARPVEPGTCPLAHGVAGRVGRLRAYGNALCAPAAEAFVRAYMEATGGG